MIGLVRRASRFSVVAAALSGLALYAFTIPVRAATTPPVTTGRSASGDVFITGPANTIKRFCPMNARTGFICLFTGLNETGTGIALLRGDHAPLNECNDIPITFVIENVLNDTDQPIQVLEGTCDHRGAVVDAEILPGVDENLAEFIDIVILHG